MPALRPIESISLLTQTPRKKNKHAHELSCKHDVLSLSFCIHIILEPIIQIRSLFPMNLFAIGRSLSIYRMQKKVRAL